MSDAKKSYTFRDFLIDEMARRGYTSGAQLARFLKVDPSTVTRAIDAKNPEKPGLEFIIKTAQATGKDGRELFALAYPESVQEANLSASAVIMAQSIEELPEDGQKAIRALIRGYTL